MALEWPIVQSGKSVLLATSNCNHPFRNQSASLICFLFYYELYRVNPPSRVFSACDAVTLVADSLINCEVSSADEVRTAVGQFKVGKAPCICGVYAEMLKAGGEPALKGLYTLLCCVSNSGVIPADLEKGLCGPYLEYEG